MKHKHLNIPNRIPTHMKYIFIAAIMAILLSSSALAEYFVEYSPVKDVGAKRVCGIYTLNYKVEKYSEIAQLDDSLTWSGIKQRISNELFTSYGDFNNPKMQLEYYFHCGSYVTQWNTDNPSNQIVNVTLDITETHNNAIIGAIGVEGVNTTVNRTHFDYPPSVCIRDSLPTGDYMHHGDTVIFLACSTFQDHAPDVSIENMPGVSIYTSSFSGNTACSAREYSGYLQNINSSIISASTDIPPKLNLITSLIFQVWTIFFWLIRIMVLVGVFIGIACLIWWIYVKIRGGLS
jgi:hypothetical protein